MVHPLIQRLFDEYGYPAIGEDNHDAFIGQEGAVVLFFAGDPTRYRETTDVAVVLPELIKAFSGHLTPAVVTPPAEVALQRQYGFSAWPALVFLRQGGYLGVITGIQNWGDYLRDIEGLLGAEASQAPGFKVPVVGA